MKIRLSRKLKQAASALLITMVLGGILCVFVMYYLALVQQQNTLSIRSQAWNIAIAVSEAGVEEALQALNSARTPGVPITLSSADGWTYDGTYYWRENHDSSLGGNRYVIRINLNNPNEPQIISRAYVTLPALAANTPNAFFATYGVTTEFGATTGPGIVTRAIRVYCQDYPLFRAAMVAKHKIDLKGNNILTDSFDSRSFWMSSFGQYDASVYHGNKGDVASNDGVVNTISVGNAEIYGKAHTGAEGTIAIGAQGWVGPYEEKVAGTYKDGWVLHDANFTFPDTGLPYTSGLPLGDPATIVTLTYDYTRTPTNSTVYPNPPPWSGVTTNVLWQNSNLLPSPIPAGLVTNTVWDKSTWEPWPGTYIPPYTKDGSWYYYRRIIGYSWPTYSYAYSLYSTNAVYTTNYYDHVISSGDYYSTDDLHGSTIVLGEARLVLPNGLSMSGNDKITIAPSGSLKMYCGGTSCTVGGLGVANEAGYAEDFFLACTESVKTFTFNGNGEFIGVMVAPEATATLNGAGSVNNDFIGSLMMSSITLNGHFKFHYDEALMAKFPNPRLLVKSWDEIP